MELEVMLNEVAEDIVDSREDSSEANTETFKKKMNVYLYCPSCQRRIAEVLFQGHSCCMHCRGVDINGNKVINKRDEWGGL